MLNKILIIVNAGYDAEMLRPQHGTDSPVEFSVACNYRRQGQEDVVEWFQVEAHGRVGERAYNTVKKGMRVFVEGRLKSSSGVSQSGNQWHRNTIVASNVIPFPKGGS